MKITLLLIFLASPAQASLVEGMVIGSMLTKSSKTEVKVVDEFSKQTSVIDQKLQEQLRYPYQSELTFLVPKKEQEKYLVYFKNQGYKVSAKGNELTFDFKEENESYLLQAKYQEEARIESQKAMDEKWSGLMSFFHKYKYWLAGLFLLVAIPVTMIQNAEIFEPFSKLLKDLVKQHNDLIMRRKKD